MKFSQVEPLPGQSLGSGGRKLGAPSKPNPPRKRSDSGFLRQRAIHRVVIEGSCGPPLARRLRSIWTKELGLKKPWPSADFERDRSDAKCRHNIAGDKVVVSGHPGRSQANLELIEASVNLCLLHDHTHGLAQVPNPVRDACA
jgi:hypothetical protein